MKKILFIVGSLNQTTMMYRISRELPEYDCCFSAYYCDGFEKKLLKLGLLDFSVLGKKYKDQAEALLAEKNCKLDYEGKSHNYDLVVTCSDLIVPKNIRDKKVILVQEGMTDPENLGYHLVKKLHIPRYLGSTSTTGLSDMYDIFCVASEGYKDLFVRKGVNPEKIAVTGIPNFDDCAQFLRNDFPYRNYVLVCTSDSRETYKVENRKKFILDAVEIANGKQLIFKLHPNELVPRATREINKWAPGALIFSSGNTNQMIANCDVLITRFSTVVYVGLALGKKVYSEFDLEDLKRQVPIQNGGRSARNIANICRKVLDPELVIKEFLPSNIDRLINKSYHAAG